MNEANSSSLAKLNRLLAVCRLKQRRYGRIFRITVPDGRVGGCAAGSGKIVGCDWISAIVQHFSIGFLYCLGRPLIRVYIVIYLELGAVINLGTVSTISVASALHNA